MEINKKRRSIRDIPITNRDVKQSSKPRSFYTEGGSDINLKKIVKPNPVVRINEKDSCTESFIENENIKQRWSKKNNKYVLIVSGAIFLFVVIFSLMNIFSAAEVNLVLKSAEIKSKFLSIALADEEGATASGALNYKKIKFDETSDITINASKEELVKQKSSGTVTVYNMYSEKEQNWIKNTRFESPGGLIFRSPDGITVPGYKTVNGEIVPGQKTIEIFADNIGEKYNLPSNTNFKIPAFAGQDSYDLFYAISDSNIEGGFDGVRKVVSEDDLASAKEKLEVDLRNKLILNIKEQVPSGMIALYNETLFKFGTITQKDSGQSTTVLSQEGSLSAMLIDKKGLAQIVASGNLTDYREGEEVSIKNIDDIEIVLVDNGGTYNVQLSGNMEIIWEIDEDKLKNDLSGKPASSIKEILADYRSVTSVKTDFSFVWNKKFPTNIKRIKINKK